MKFLNFERGFRVLGEILDFARDFRISREISGFYLTLARMPGDFAVVFE